MRQTVLYFDSQREPVSYSEHAQADSGVPVKFLIQLVDGQCVQVIWGWIHHTAPPQHLQDQTFGL